MMILPYVTRRTKHGGPKTTTAAQRRAVNNAARLVQLQRNNMPLFTKVSELAKDNAALLAPLLSAADIIESRHAYNGGLVASQNPKTRDHLYQVRFEFSQYSCDCKAFEFSRATLEGYGTVCKHCLAQHLACLLDLRLATIDSVSEYFLD